VSAVTTRGRSSPERLVRRHAPAALASDPVTRPERVSSATNVQALTSRSVDCSAGGARRAGAHPRGTGGDHEVSISAGTLALPGTLGIPASPGGLVVFAHGSGSSRLSPRNLQVAGALQRAGLATLLFDLLTEREARDRANVFDIPLLGERLLAASRFAAGHRSTAALGVGYFGASTGAAAALWAAAEAGGTLQAVVSRGGRPDLAAERLSQVTAPTLMIVGGRDTTVLALNEEAAAHLLCRHEIAVVPGATHLFEEAGALEQVAQLAVDWFCSYLMPQG
jgi:putative phosphoribosyl transferase